MSAWSKAAGPEEFERAAKYRDLISTVEQLQEKQRIAAVEGDDADVFGYHYENGMLAVNLFHMRGGRVLDRREFFWEDLPIMPAGDLELGQLAKFAALARRTGQTTRAIQSVRAASNGISIPASFFSALLKQLYIGQPYVPRNIYVPVEFEDREMLEELLSEQLAGDGGRATRVHILVPQRGDKRSLLDLAGNNAKQSYDQRFRVMKPNTKAIQEALQDALGLPELPERIECFDISHIQGAETVASMVVWEDGQMKKSDYRKFIIRTVEGVDDFAVHARSGLAALQTDSGRKEEDAQPDPDRWRSRPIACRGRSARIDRDHQSAAGGDRQARGNYLCAGTGKRAGRARSPFPGAPSGATDSR